MRARFPGVRLTPVKGVPADLEGAIFDAWVMPTSLLPAFCSFIANDLPALAAAVGLPLPAIVPNGAAPPTECDNT